MPESRVRLKGSCAAACAAATTAFGSGRDAGTQALSLLFRDGDVHVYYARSTARSWRHMVGVLLRHCVDGRAYGERGDSALRAVSSAASHEGRPSWFNLM